MKLRAGAIFAGLGTSLLALLAMIAAWTPPLSGLLGSAAVAIGSIVPRGRVWRAPGPSSSTGPPQLDDWANATRWLEDSAWLVLAAVVIARLAIWWGVGWKIARGRDVPGTFAGWAESLSAVAWCLGAAVAWRLAWGLQYDRLVAGQTPVPVAMGGLAVVSLWLGAAIGHGVVVFRLRRRTPGEGECASCGYPRAADAARCPECGRDSKAPTESRHTRRLPGVALALACVLLAMPYVASWLSVLVPYSWLNWVFLRVPQNW